MRWPRHQLRSRPRGSGDPVFQSAACHAEHTRPGRVYWVPAFAGTTIESFVAIALAIAIVSPATAQDSRFKDVNLYVGSGAGGPYDAYARLVGRHLGKHLPGNPNVVVQNMPGASGRRLITYMTTVAPKDGTALALVQRGNAFEPLMGEAQFDVESIAWIGNANDE